MRCRKSCSQVFQTCQRKDGGWEASLVFVHDPAVHATQQGYIGHNFFALLARVSAAPSSNDQASLSRATGTTWSLATLTRACKPGCSSEFQSNFQGEKAFFSRKLSKLHQPQAKLTDMLVSLESAEIVLPGTVACKPGREESDLPGT